MKFLCSQLLPTMKLVKSPVSLSPRPHHESIEDAGPPLRSYEGFSAYIPGTLRQCKTLSNAGFTKPGTGVRQEEMAGGLEKVKGGLWESTSLLDCVTTGKQGHAALANRTSQNILVQEPKAQPSGSLCHLTWKAAPGTEKSLVSTEITHHCKATSIPNGMHCEKRAHSPTPLHTGTGS